MPILVVKFLDTIYIPSLAFGPYSDVFEPLPSFFTESAKIVAAQATYGRDYPISKAQVVLDRIRRHSLKLRFLFRQTKPEHLQAIVEQAVKNTGTYAFANLFSFFTIEAEAAKLMAVWKDLSDFVLINSADYFLRPLDYVFWRQPATLAQSLGCSPNESPRQDFWDSLGILTYWQNMSSTNLFRNSEQPPEPSETDLIIHCVEYGWAGNEMFASAVLSPLDATAEPDHGKLHGCAVLGVLVAQWSENKPPTAVQENAIQGIVPMARIKTYAVAAPDSLYEEEKMTWELNDFRDDALAQAIYSARSRPGDLILLEMDLPDLPFYDREAKIEADLSNSLARVRVPLELDQVIFELIQIATHKLRLVVLEPAGNGSVDLNTLTTELAEKDRQNRLGLKKALPDLPDHVYNYLYRRIVRPTSRYIGFDLRRDSGAIMVGAAEEDGKWKRFIGSNHGMRVDVFGPGKAVLTTYPVSIDGTGRGVICQTSAATAVVAGMVAALQVVQKQKSPDQPFNYLQLRSALRDTDTLQPEEVPVPNLYQLRRHFF